MKWGTQRDARWKASQEWHRWFAWHPINLYGVGTVWLEWIERRRVIHYDVYWEYRV